MTRPTTRKLPAHRGVFSYARIPLADGAVAYRLFRRDMRRVLHAELKNFHIARHQLRNTVDEIDLEIMGVTQ